MTLRVISDESDPLSLDELKSHGDGLLTEAKAAAAEALLASVRPEWLFQRSSRYDLYAVKDLCAKARETAQAWAKVEGLLAELLNEVDKSKRTK